MNTKTKLLIIGTQQYSSYIYIANSKQYICLKNNHIFYVTCDNLKIHTKRNIASKKQDLEHRQLQRSILLVRGDHCVGNWLLSC